MAGKSGRTDGTPREGANAAHRAQRPAARVPGSGGAAGYSDAFDARNGRCAGDERGQREDSIAARAAATARAPGGATGPTGAGENVMTITCEQFLTALADYLDADTLAAMDPAMAVAVRD